MSKSHPALVVNVSLAGPERDYDEHVTFLHHDFRLLRVGTSGNVAAAEELVRKWVEDASAIAVTGIREARAIGRYGGELEAIAHVKRATSAVPVTDGYHLGDVLQEWAIRHVQTEMPGYFNNARTVVLGGLYQDRCIRVLREFTQNLEFANPLLRLGLPARLQSNALLGMAVDVGLWPVRRLPHRIWRLPRPSFRFPGSRISNALALAAARDCDVVVATYEELIAFGLEDLAGKTVVTSAISDERLVELAGRGVDLVVDTTPQPFRHVTVSAAVLEAMMLALVSSHEHLTDDDLLDMVDAAGLRPRLLYPNGPKRRSRFAFVIHPLSQQYLSNVEPLRTIAKVSLPPVMDVVEKAMAYAPPFTYSHVGGIKSPTGAEAEGWLITVGGTPRELMAHSPEFTYARLLAAARMAQMLGAQVMGLGAFTKVVGDAGVTVAKQAPLPITTGNSYSASGALWAAHEAVNRLGLAEVDEAGRIKGKTMVVGATG
ncbi:MAG TPA: hypothetical protein VF163_04885, partial [Micromonosporaceae bacterium]